MESDFFDLFESIQHQHPGFVLDVGYTKVTDWVITVWDRKKVSDLDNPCVLAQDCDRKLAFAQAHVALCEYMSETYGGY